MNEDDTERGEDLSAHATNQEDVPATPPKEASLTRDQRIRRWFEVITAIMLGVVSVATAWSGYQAARWGGVQSTSYARANSLRQEASRDSTLAGLTRLYDLILVDDWLNAHSAGNTTLANTYERRFRPQFLPIFKAWLALDPFTNTAAPPGPLFMPQYKLGQDQQANQLNARAAAEFGRGQAAAQLSDNYILNTVFLSTVLFLTAMAGNFQWKAMRVVILGVALAMLLLGFYHLITYPIR